MLTLALDSSMYVAYDLQNCRLYKAWKGGVNWDGIVYNDTKVIQPTTWGTDYVKDTPAGPVWWLEHNSEKVIPEVQFIGYRFKDQQIYLSYTLVATIDTIHITERPEFIAGKDGTPGLERVFYRSGTSELPVYLSTQSQTLAINQPVVTLRSEFQALPEQIQEQSLVRTDDKGRYWLEKSDCLTCHEWTENTVGPGFRQIADKYVGSGAGPDVPESGLI
jgi:cytochrome c